MFTKAMLSVFGERKDLGNKIHSHYVYDSWRAEQIRAKERFTTLADDS